jgi:hypothetical protein
MKTKFTYLTMTALASVLAFAASGVVLAENPTPDLNGVQSLPISNKGVVPYIISDLVDDGPSGPNRTCADVGVAYFNDVDYFQCYTDKRDYNGGFTGEFQNQSVDTACGGPVSVQVTDGKFVTWSIAAGLGYEVSTVGAIVKGSADANVYVSDGLANDSGLASPPAGSSGGPADLSNLTFCWNVVEGSQEECWEGETAWAANGYYAGQLRYTTRGNWATYTQYNGSAKTVKLFAGQTMNAGMVHFSAPANGKVIIAVTLNEGWRFAPKPADEMGDYENLKVQDYATNPSGNPAPGLFEWKKECTASPCQIEVDPNNFYGVHADVEQQVECTE